MDKAAIKNFAVWARNKLIADITYRAGLLGVSEKGIADPLPQSTRDLQFFDIGTKEYAKVIGPEIEQRKALEKAIRNKEQGSDYKTAFKVIVEEVAYTWFNRLIAIRFMEVNDYLPSRIRVLSSENPAKNEPDFITTPFETDIRFATEDQDKIMRLKDENKLDDLFRMLFIKQCNKLHDSLPELFEETNDYTELLLNISFTDMDGVVYHLVHDIEEKDFDVTTVDEDGKTTGQVEIIGWLYQYYNIEPKDETFALLKKNVKITRERIPAATQLFTPDWIVRYMVENSLGRLWVEGHPNDKLEANWKYYLEEAEQETDVQTQLEEIRKEYRKLNPEDIKVIDPCMGSGHILVYCFDVLMQIYESQGYTQKDAVQSILEHNLFGLDIDKRAAQLAYFAVMMKARQYDRRIFNREIKPHVYAIEESNGINREQLKYFGATLSPVERNNAQTQMIGLLDTMTDAKEYGSILNVENYDWDLLRRFAENTDDEGQMTFDTVGIEQTQMQLFRLLVVSKIIAMKSHIVITNPPYMGIKNMSVELGNYVRVNYPENKYDLYGIFIEKMLEKIVPTGLLGMISQQTFMFLSRYEYLRKKVLINDIINLIHLGTRAFEEIGGEVVQTATYVIRKSNIVNYNASYINLCNFENAKDKQIAFLEKENLYIKSKDSFGLIAGSPMAYWVTKRVGEIFNEGTPLENLTSPRQGMATSDNDRFLRLWFEVNIQKIGFNHKNREEALASGNKWFPYNKGGGFRKWYGNTEYVVNWENDGNEIKKFREYKNSTLDSNMGVAGLPFIFKENITWSKVCSAKFSVRYLPEGFLFDVAGCSIYAETNVLKYTMALLNSKVMGHLLSAISQSLNFEVGSIKMLPIITVDGFDMSLVDENCGIAKSDWDAYETSWDFIAHPIVLAACSSEIASSNSERNYKCTVSDAYVQWEDLCKKRFNQLKFNEEKLNSIFIEIYGLQEELKANIEESDVSVQKAELGRDIRSLLSYAVGCMFGRYSLDKSGLICAGKYDSSKYKTYIPDEDNCIPITDEEYFEDDIVGQFCEWMKKTFGTENLEENLDFIAKALGNKGATSREVIRNYFLNDFIKDHNKVYQKRPIYWLFDSGKQNGFKALVYMHRWDADTVGNLRVEYLHKIQHTYEQEILRMQEIIDNSHDSREVANATKRKDKLQKQLKETKDYDAKLAHIALSRIEIDLDDGVKVNYEKVQTDREGKKLDILAKL